MTARQPIAEPAAGREAAPIPGQRSDHLQPAAGAGRYSQYFGALARYPIFRQLWFSMMAASAGQWMQQIAIGWLALVITDSPSFVGIVTFVAGVPFLLVGPPAGTLIDRFDRRKLLLVCQSLAATLALVIAAVIFAGLAQPWHLLVAAFLNGCVLSLMTPTQQSLVPTLVERKDLTNAIALMSAGQNLSRVAGPSVAGLMIAWWDVGPAFLAQAILLAVAFCLVLRITLPRRAVVAATASGLFDGLRIIWRTPEIRALFIMVAISMFFVFPYISFANVLARDILMIGANGLGLLMAASGSGAVIGALYVAARGRASGVGATLISLSILYGVVVIGVALSTSPWLTAGLMFGGSFMGALAFSLNTALVQHRIRDEVRGRVMSAYFLTWGLMPIGALPMGLLADRYGVSAALITGATIASVLTAILALKSSALRNI